MAFANHATPFVSSRLFCFSICGDPKFIFWAHLHPVREISRPRCFSIRQCRLVLLDAPGQASYDVFVCDVIRPFPTFSFAIESIRPIRIGMDPNCIPFFPSVRICQTSHSHARINACFRCRTEFLLNDHVLDDLS
jgi:hypothetical protein